MLISSIIVLAGCEIEGGSTEESYEPTVPQAPTKGKWVDLGLSVAWAGWNVGASSPEEYGGCYAWGETISKTIFDAKNYKYSINQSSWEHQDIGNDISGTKYDVAYTLWGDDARIPKYDEVKELCESCDWISAYYNGIEGYYVVGPNGNAIFLPSTGMGSIDGIQGQGDYGYYWTSTVCDNLNAYHFYGGKRGILAPVRRCFGCSIRPVSDNPDYSDMGDSEDNSGSGGSSSGYEKPEIGFYDYTPNKTSVKVQYKIYNKDEAKVSSAKIYYGTSSNPTSSKSATVSGVLITANLTGLKAGTTYYVKCVATGKGGTATTSVTKVMTNY